MYYGLAADAVVVFHLAYVLTVLFGLLVTILGGILGWNWVRNFWFRIAHLGMILIVVVESLLGIECPLTTWERDLRTMAGEEVSDGSFVGRLAHEILFVEDAPAWIFTACYAGFGLAVLLVFIFIPPRRPFAKPVTRGAAAETVATSDATSPESESDNAS